MAARHDDGAKKEELPQKRQTINDEKIFKYNRGDDAGSGAAGSMWRL